MAANLNMFVFVFSFAIIFGLLPSFCNCQTNSDTINSNTDISNCSCDLTANACDVNCCCDWECDEYDKEVFSTCIDEYTPPDSRVCVRNDIIIRNNTAYETEETVEGLFCIYRDNYEERNFYEVPTIVDSSEQFDDYKARYGSCGYQQQVLSVQPGTQFYTEGDVIYTIYESGALGLLGQPSSLTSGYCTDTNPAAFLQTKQLECTRELTTLAEQCMTSLPLDTATYYQGFRVVTTPEAFADYPRGTDPVVTTASPTTVDPAISSDSTPLTTVVMETTQTDNVTTVAMTTSQPVIDVDPLYNSSYAIDIVPTNEHICIDQDGLNITCPFTGADLPSPEYDQNTGICNYTVIKVDYIITHNGSLGIESVRVQFTFKEVAETQLPLTQAFNTQYFRGGESGVYSVSGNPGYVVGLPVRAGTLTSYQDSNDNPRLAINENTDLLSGITIVTSQANGLCTNSTNAADMNRVPLMFGENLRSGCFVQVSYEDLTTVCQLIQESVLQALLGPSPPTHVATWGNSSIEVTGDWVQILTDDAPSTSTPSNGDTCRDVVTGMHWEILYSNVGALDNPQAKIIGVAYSFTVQDIKYQCYSAFCQPDTQQLTQRFEIVSSVEYIDASEPAVGQTAERPTISARLPDDFFYPFS